MYWTHLTFFFEDCDAQSKAAELERLHAAMREKLKIAS